MRVHRRIRNLTEPEQAQFEDYLDKKLSILQPMIDSHYPDEDTVHVFARIQKHHKHTAFAYECIVEMPRKRLVTSETKHTITEVLDFATERIEQGMVKHFKKWVKA